MLGAFLAGVPVVGTDVIGVRDAVEPGVTGLLVAPRPLDVAAAVMRPLDEPTLRPHWRGQLANG